MRESEIAIGIISLIIWIYLFFARGHFWRVNSLFAPASTSAAPVRIAAIIPARNEEKVISLSIASLLQLPSVVIIVVDDNSTDDTSLIAQETAVRNRAGGRVTVVRGTPVPSGWSGKLWAMQQGVERVRQYQPDFFLFTDADILHTRTDLERLIAVAQNGNYDLASLMVRLRCETVAERLLIPTFVYFFFKLYPPAFIQDSNRHAAGAAGGCILLRPEALQRAGGLEPIRHEIIDDCALARTVKCSGGKVWIGLAQKTSSIRRYESFAEIGRMISRTAFNQLHHSSWLLAGTILGLVLTYVAPVALVLSGNLIATALGIAVLALMIASYVPVIRYYGRSLIWALTLPVAAIFYMGATIWSAVKFWSGRGGEWKGRAQDLARSS